MLECHEAIIDRFECDVKDRPPSHGNQRRAPRGHEAPRWIDGCHPSAIILHAHCFTFVSFNIFYNVRRINLRANRRHPPQLRGHHVGEGGPGLRAAVRRGERLRGSGQDHETTTCNLGRPDYTDGGIKVQLVFFMPRSTYSAYFCLNGATKSSPSRTMPSPIAVNRYELNICSNSRGV
jgi:hypothetical protein